MGTARGNLARTAAVVLAAAGLPAGGCVHTLPAAPGPAGHESAIAVPPPGAVPRELEKVTYPEYVIEPPDVLRIEVGIIARAEDLQRQFDEENRGRAEGRKLDESQRPTADELRSLPLQPIAGDYTVQPDGTVYFGVYGHVQLAGYTRSQAQTAIRDAIVRQTNRTPESVVVILDVAAYNSKQYYVITDGGGYGEQVFAFPPVGSETVLDAIKNIGGLPPVASKRNIWIARRCPIPGHPEQILPVDWVGITQHGVTATNYQVMPGDRVYVKAQRLVTIDTALARIISPVERVFGITLLGTTTVNQLQGRGTGFNGQ